MRFGALAILIAAPLLAQQPTDPTTRDLKIEPRPASAEELKQPVNPPRAYAVVIGISKYKNLPEKNFLKYGESDAQKVLDVLLSNKAGNMEYENVNKLIGENATLANMRDALEKWLPSKAQPGDRVVVYFVGHGAVDDSDGRGYLLPYDVDPQHFASTGYSMERLGQVMSSQVKARWKMLLVDACHSGTISVSSTVEKVNQSLQNVQQQAQGFLTLLSSRSGEVSYEFPGLGDGNGAFSYFLEQGWKGDADVDPQDGVVTADELINFVRREVRNYVRTIARANGKDWVQNPLDLGHFDDDMILGYNPGKRSQLAGKLPELANGTIVVDVNLDDVEVRVDGQRRGTASKSDPLPIPGLKSGPHTVSGYRMGYEPVEMEINVTPGTRQTVTLRILRQRVVKPAAQAAYDDAEKIWTRSGATPADLARAFDQYSRALKEDPTFSPAALGLCRVQQAQGKPDKAVKSCAKAIQLDADFLEARETYAAVLMETGDYPEAVRQLQQGVIAAPKDTFAHSMLAEALYLADRAPEAETEANKAIELDGSSAQAYLMRGEARRAQERFPEAAADYHRVLDLEQYGSSKLRVILYFGIGSGMTKSRSGLQALYRSHAAAAWFGLCACEMEQEKYLQAIRSCTKSLSIEKDDPDTYFELGEVYARRFNAENIRDYLVRSGDSFNKVLSLNPYYERAPEVKKKLGEINALLAKMH